MPNIAAVVFDFDGTLVDESKIFEQSLIYACKAVGFTLLGKGEIKRLAKQHPDIYLQRVIPNDIADRNKLVERFLKSFTEAYERNGHKQAKLVKHAKPLLRALKMSGVKVGLITRRITLWRAVPEILQMFSISTLVDRVVTCREAESKVEQLRICLKDLQVKASASSVVGDTAEDIYAGKAVGCLTIAYTKGFGSKIEILRAEPDYLVADLIDVLQILASIK
ncbi:MAG: HAD family hydrolase [Nitrososphaerales archaeon]